MKIFLFRQRYSSLNSIFLWAREGVFESDARTLCLCFFQSSFLVPVGSSLSLSCLFTGWRFFPWDWKTFFRSQFLLLWACFNQMGLFLFYLQKFPWCSDCHLLPKVVFQLLMIPVLLHESPCAQIFSVIPVRYIFWLHWLYLLNFLHLPAIAQ